MKKYIFFLLFLYMCWEFGFLPLPTISGNRPQIIAHRGDSTNAPENTLPAFQLAIQHGADGLEFDVRLSKDRIPVVIHDAHLSRIADIDRLVADVTLQQLSSLRIQSDNSSQYSDASVCSLEEALATCQNRIRLHLDLKISGMEQQIVYLIQKYDLSGQCEIASSDPNVLRRIKELDSQLTTVLILSTTRDLLACLSKTHRRFPDYADETIDGYSARARLLTASFIRTMHRKGKFIYAWTVNSASELRRMQRLDADAVITDNPQKAVAILRSSYAP